MATIAAGSTSRPQDRAGFVHGEVPMAEAERSRFFGDFVGDSREYVELANDTNLSSTIAEFLE
jgi:hypothetical protein